MRRVRGLVLSAVMAVGAFALVGCSSDGDATDAPETTAVAADTTAAPETTAAAETTVAPETTADTAAREAAASTCADDGARLPLTGICAGRAANYLDPDRLTTDTPTPDGCDWRFTETPLVDEVVVYRALSCKGITTSLDYAGGAHSAELSYASSALYGDAAKGQVLVRVFSSDPADPNASILAQREGLPADEAERCVVRPAGGNGWPKDALVLAYDEATSATLPTDGPNAMCGDFGLDEDTQSFWLVRDGYAWFFTLGQDDADIDPASFTVFAKGADGTWAPVTPS